MKSQVEEHWVIVALQNVFFFKRKRCHLISPFYFRLGSLTCFGSYAFIKASLKYYCIKNRLNLIQNRSTKDIDYFTDCLFVYR